MHSDEPFRFDDLLAVSFGKSGDELVVRQRTFLVHKEMEFDRTAWGNIADDV
jgi:hypothetical protein